jgi:hypothetical protein
MLAEVFMSISDRTLERRISAPPHECGAMTRRGEPKRLTSIGLLGKAASYAVPHIAEDRRVSIAKTAYLRAARRGFAAGHDLEDWLEAENEVDQRLAGEGRVF